MAIGDEAGGARGARSGAGAGPIRAFLAPTRRKLTLAAGCFLVFPVLLALRAIPHRWDLLDLRIWSERVLTLLLGVPIRLFDAVTGSAFASKSEAFLVFPTGVQIGAAGLADAILFYTVACAWIHRSARRARGSEAGSARPST